jgi:hypothetical protein
MPAEKSARTPIRKLKSPALGRALFYNDSIEESIYSIKNSIIFYEY